MKKRIWAALAALCSSMLIAFAVASMAFATPAKAATSGNEAMRIMASYLRDAGFGATQTAAIIGNVYAESGCDSNAKFTEFYDAAHGWEYGYGLFQYTHVANGCASEKPSATYGTCELCRYVRWCNLNGYSPDNIYAQLYWTFQGDGNWRSRWCERGSYYSSYVHAVSSNAQKDSTPNAFLQEKDLASATYSWMAYYEGPSNVYCHYDVRIARARSVLAALVGPGWFYENGSYRYFTNSSGSLAYGWLQLSGKWYYFNGYGNLVVSDWVKSGGKSYYLGSNGAMVTNSWVKSGGKYYYLNSSGNPVMNDWVAYKGKYYYMNSAGNPVMNDWITYKGKYYYMNSAGNPVMNDWITYKGKHYCLGADGAAIANEWASYGGKWYYMGADGTPVVNGWVYSGGKWYYMGADGIPVTDGWAIDANGYLYWMDAAGNPVRDAWVEIDGSELYFDAYGHLVEGATHCYPTVQIVADPQASATAFDVLDESQRVICVCEPDADGAYGTLEIECDATYYFRAHDGGPDARLYGIRVADDPGANQFKVTYFADGVWGDPLPVNHGETIIVSVTPEIA